VSLRIIKHKKATDREHWRDLMSITLRLGFHWNKNAHILTASDELWEQKPEVR
jgi:hypothetical protein